MFLKRFRLKGLAHQPKELVRISEHELKTRSVSGAAVIDVRPGARFAEGHFPGSLNIGLISSIFAVCVGQFVPKECEIFLVVEKAEDASKAQADLARAGFDQVQGMIEAGDLTELHRLTQLTVLDLNSTLFRGGKPAILDVRSQGEWKSNRICGSKNIPLAQLTSRVAELSLPNPLVVVCQDGYQSAVASSWLQAKGFDSIQHLLGGMDAYNDAPSKESLEAFSFYSPQSSYPFSKATGCWRT
ncbi:MAG: rhodanese-like domain-containing protein [Verrucomicrobia bacterium]|nr:rhodanese-like domain-containing protein [Verrucomicrobiota bacterium]